MDSVIWYACSKLYSSLQNSRRGDSSVGGRSSLTLEFHLGYPLTHYLWYHGVSAVQNLFLREISPSPLTCCQVHFCMMQCDSPWPYARHVLPSQCVSESKITACHHLKIFKHSFKVPWRWSRINIDLFKVICIVWIQNHFCSPFSRLFKPCFVMVFQSLTCRVFWFVLNQISCCFMSY